MTRKSKVCIVFALLAVALPLRRADAAGGGGNSGGSVGGGYWEISAGGSYSRSNYTEGSYSWTRRLGSSVGYHFTDRSELEFGFSDTVDRTVITGYEDTTFRDRMYSVNWVQSLTGRDFPIQPYVKGGVGQLNRDASGSYANGSTPTTRVDSVSVIVGGGIRIYITKGFAIRGEVSSYLTGGSVRTYRDNVSSTIGLSLYF